MPTLNDINAYWRTPTTPGKTRLNTLFSNRDASMLKYAALSVCFGCFMSLTDSYVKRGYLVSLHKGGTRSYENTVPLCPRCHASKPAHGSREEACRWLRGRSTFQRYLESIGAVLTNGQVRQEAVNEALRGRTHTHASFRFQFGGVA
ncbi:HNH endonuclease [Dermabacteraceae bacterium P7006]